MTDAWWISFNKNQIFWVDRGSALDSTLLFFVLFLKNSILMIICLFTPCINSYIHELFYTYNMFGCSFFHTLESLCELFGMLKKSNPLQKMWMVYPLPQRHAGSYEQESLPLSKSSHIFLTFFLFLFGTLI